jgi:hypothetical protein
MSATSKRTEGDALRQRLLEQQPQSKPLLDRLLTKLNRKNDIGPFAPIRERRCSGCHMTVPAVRLQRAKTGEFISCSGCARFLYIELS